MENDISKPWPKMVDFEQTEAGWNTYLDAWINRKRQASGLAQIPIASIDEHRAAIALGQKLGWQENE
jgi:hypothetical protein